jgi:HEAT repeat protein
MIRNRLIFGLLILSCIITTGTSRADTGTVDTEIVAATKAGPTELKNLELRSIETIKSNASTMEKDRACRILRVIGTPDSIDALGALLTDKKLSHIARYALEYMRYPEVDKALSDALDKTSGKVKVGIINSLAMRGNKQHYDILVPLLKDSDTEVAAAAIWALGRIGSSQAVSTLSERYKYGGKKMRSAAADGLLNATDRLVAKGDLPKALAIYKQLHRADAPEHVRMGAFRGLIETQPDKAAGMLIEAIGSNDWKTRGMAIDMIVTLKGQGVTERFTAGLDKLAPDTQVLMIGALVGRGEKDALRPVITKAATSSNAEIRALAIKSLGDIGDASSVQVLVNVIETGKNDEEKKLSASSLRRLSGKNINGQIIKSMKKSTAEGRAKLIEILQDRDATEAVDELLAAGSDKDAEVRRAAFKALADLAGPDHQKALIKLLSNLKGNVGRPEAKRTVKAVTQNLNEAASLEPIQVVINSTAATKCSFLRVLGGIGDADGFVVVRHVLKDSNPEVRDTAVRTLADWPVPTAARTLLEVFQTTSNRTHRIVALRGCVRQLGMGALPSSDMLNICSQLMKGTDRPEEKKLILACLAKSGDPGATKIVVPLLADNKVKAEAELAMLGIIRNMMGPKPDDAKAAAQTLRKKSKNKSIKKEAAAVIRLVEKFEDYIMAWQVSGPYSKPFAIPYDTEFGPEKANAEDVLWKILPISKTGNRPWMFDLQKTLRGQKKAGYVRTWVHTDEEQAARLDFGTDDGNKLWLNGKLVHANAEGGAAVPGEHKVAVKLQKGWNVLLLKVTQDTGTWQFCLAIRKPNGDKLEGLSIQAAKPTK